MNTKKKQCWEESDKGVSSFMFHKRTISYSASVQNFMELANRFPAKEETMLLWSIKQFNTFSVILAAIKTYGYVDELYVTSYNISKKTIDMLYELYNDGHIGRVKIFASSVSKHHFPASYDRLAEITASNDRFEVKYAWNHSKIALFKSKDNFFVCEGSGNFSQNAKFEQYVLYNSKDVYDFRLSNIHMI